MRFDDAVACTKEALKRHNFTVLSEIDMKDTLKKAINIDFHPYLILGVCNPQLAYRALQAEDKIGAMLPCNIVLQQRILDAAADNLRVAKDPGSNGSRPR